VTVVMAFSMLILLLLRGWEAVVMVARGAGAGQSMGAVIGVLNSATDVWRHVWLRSRPAAAPLRPVASRAAGSTRGVAAERAVRPAQSARRPAAWRRPLAECWPTPPAAIAAGSAK